MTIVTVTPYLRGRLRFLLVLGFVTQGISLQVSKCLAEQIKPWFFSSFYWKRLKLLKLTLFISQSWLFDFNATWKIFKELNSKWKRVSFRHFNLWILLLTHPDSTKIIFCLFPIISISQKFLLIFFLTLEKIGIDKKVICCHNISN